MAHAWKACWVNALGGSNPPSSAARGARTCAAGRAPLLRGGAPGPAGGARTLSAGGGGEQNPSGRQCRLRSRPGPEARMDVPMSVQAPTGEPVAGSEPHEELREAREQLAATNEILGVLARSTGDPDAVFDAIVANARRLCHAQVALIHLVEEDRLPHRPLRRPRPRGPRVIRAHPVGLDRSTLVGAGQPGPDDAADHGRPRRPRVRPAGPPAPGRLPVHPRRPHARRRRGGRDAVGLADQRRALRRARRAPCSAPSPPRRRWPCATCS